MENGPWDFAPDWYYYLFHKSYSGASLHWRWRGFHSGLYVEFDENDSNVKRIMPVRVTSEETQRQKMKKADEEMKLIAELHKEEVAREADRSVDLVYASFKDDFNRMQNSITEGLLFCMTKSKGKMKFQVNELSRQNEILCQNVAYLHKQGIGYGLENAKREKGYIDAKKQMEELVSRTAHLVGMAQVYYK
jgi:alpha-L-fucosidase